MSILRRGVLLGVALVLLAGGRAGAKAFEPNWESLTSHEVPEWLLDAKFGIYAHWGVYSVPAFGNEWYAKRMYDKKDSLGTYDHHVKTYGPPEKFGYKDLVPMFKAENYDPAELAEFIAKSGAKYAGIAVVHHDGFGLWDSDVSDWNAGKMGPKRDLYGDLVKELRKQEDMKVIATFHHIRTFDWYLPSSQAAIDEGRAAGWDLFDQENRDYYWNRYIGEYDDFMQQWRAKVEEVSDKYQPDVLWFDGGNFQEAEAEKFVLSILRDYYNKGERWGKEVEVLNKLPSSMKFNFPREFGVLTFEEGRDRAAVVDRPWIDDMKISDYGWGYLEGQTYKSANEIIDGLIDRMARGGGLLLSLCSKADGTISGEQKNVLVEMGEWLRQNGDAIYGTRPWKIHSEGPTDDLNVTGGRHPKWVFDKCGADDIRFTMKDDVLYAIVLGWPEGGELRIKSLGEGTTISEGGIRRIRLLGNKGLLAWTRNAEGLTIALPADKPNEIAYAFKISLRGALDK